MEHLLSNIQRMCMQDGPGIRTTVFMKGCGIHCPWCSNPENLSFEAEEYTRSDGKGVYGSSYSIDEIYQEIIKDKDYWGSDGGVTFSGGEALMHMDFLQELFRRLKDQETPGGARLGPAACGGGEADAGSERPRPRHPQHLATGSSRRHPLATATSHDHPLVTATSRCHPLAAQVRTPHPIPCRRQVR